MYLNDFSTNVDFDVALNPEACVPIMAKLNKSRVFTKNDWNFSITYWL